MTTLREAAQQALEALEICAVRQEHQWHGLQQVQIVKAALRAALEQPEQEPVAHFGSAYVNENGVHITTVLGPVAIPQDAKLYTHPPRREWQPLTEEEISALFPSHLRGDYKDLIPYSFARAIEAALKERNEN